MIREDSFVGLVHSEMIDRHFSFIGENATDEAIAVFAESPFFLAATCCYASERLRKRHRDAVAQILTHATKSDY